MYHTDEIWHEDEPISNTDLKSEKHEKLPC